MINQIQSEQYSSSSSTTCASLTKETARLCAVCGDVSDGPHFGAFACRACAAFFRRTVTLKLEYRCRADSECNIDTLARNMCRSCRFQKCLMVGMVATAVQNTRDGIGKRSSSSSKLYLDKQPRNQNYELGLSAGPFDGHSSEPRSTVNHSSELEVSPTRWNLTITAQMRILPKILEGYNHFLSIRKASFSLAQNKDAEVTFEERPRKCSNMSRSSFDLVQKVCRMDSHIAVDIVNNYFIPFKELPPREKLILFKNFFCYFCHADRTYQSYKVFGNELDCIIMPDGGYIKMSELEKFYENSTNCKADPKEAARIFRPFMQSMVDVIVQHMKRIEISEYEFAALIGLLLWNDALSNIAPETLEMIWSTRAIIFEDLYIHYKSLGIADMQTAVKLGNLTLLIPKIQRNVARFAENIQVAEVFNIFASSHCCAPFRPE